MLQASLPQGRCQNLDQGIVLTVAVVDQHVERIVGERFRIGHCGFRNLAEVVGGVVEDTDHGSTAIIAALEDRVGQRHETPHQVQSLDRITFSHCVDDGAALDLQIIDQGSPVLPVDEPAGAGDRRQPFADFSRNRGGALLAGQFQPETVFGRDIAGADLDQQFGKPLSAQRRKVLRVQCLLGRHQLRCPFLVRPIVFFCGLFRTARIRSAAGNSGPGSSPRALRAPRCSALRVRPSTRATCSRWETAERRSVASNLWSSTQYVVPYAT